MIYSMTGYAARSSDVQGGALHAEVKSVNSRYLDCHFRVCDELRAVEAPLRERIIGKVKRGKVEFRVSLVANASSGPQPNLNSALLERLRDLDRHVRQVLPSATPLSVHDVLHWPGMLGDDAFEVESLLPQCLALVEATLDDFNASREREGAKLAEVIHETLARMRSLLREVGPRIPAAQAAFNEKVRQRLLEVVDTPDDDRIRQEVALFAARIDVAEELARLSTHLDEVERVLKAGGATGKRLDFLMQELNREANTLASKSLVAEVSQTAIECKLLIEQMREQVQNIE